MIDILINTGLTSGYIVNDRYRIVKQLGHGGFGRTYLAQDINRFDEPCVLKEFAPQLRGSYALEKAQELFEREAGILYRLKHCQIPRFRELFRFNYQEEGRLLLVQDYVEGQTYHELLNQREKEFTVGEASLLLWQTLPVLDYIHSYGVIHRDISPDNLILRDSDQMTVLIDFGSIKEFASKAQSELPEIFNTTETFSPVVGTVLGKTGYAPPEQMERGIVGENSDLYALAATTVVLLTGKEPSDLINPNTLQWEWQHHLKINPQLAYVLNKMLAPSQGDRFKSAQEVMDALKNNSYVLSCITKYRQCFQGLTKSDRPSVSRYLPSSPKQWLTLACVTGLTLASSWGLNHHFTVPSSPPSQPSAQVSPSTTLQVSEGENVLISTVMTPEKQLGVAAFAKGNYTQAVNFFSQSLKRKPNDPETLIYLNNAQIGEKTAYTIAVSLPISTDVNTAQEMLRGVAQGQTKINQSGNILIKIRLVNDHSNPEIGQQIADYLSGDSSILGVIGHGDSEVTLSTIPIYQKNQLTVISPVSTAVQLSDVSPYLFRTVQSDYMTGRALADQMLQQQSLTRVAIFYDSQSNDSQSLKSEFMTAVTLGGGQIVGEYDLSRSDFSATQSLNQAIANNAEVIMIANHRQTLDRALQVVQVNEKKLPILGGTQMYSPKTLEMVGRLADNMILAIPWHIQRHETSEFVQNARQQWGAEVNWRTATAYEAILAFSTAIKRSPTRVGVQQVLSDTNFMMQGISQSLRFLPSGDRQQGMERVTVRPSKHHEFGYQFTTLTNNSQQNIGD